MPRRPRSAHTSAYFHVINRSVRKATLFQTSRDYRAFLLVLNEGLQRYPLPVLAYCVLANHWHLVVGPVGTDRLSRLMQWVSATHAQRWHRRRQSVGEGPVYQGRFKSHPIDAPGQLVRVCRYVERNALTAQLVRRAQDWPWCSLSTRLALGDDVPLTSAPFLSSEAWVDHVNGFRPGEDDEPSSVPWRRESVEKGSVPLRDVAEEPGGLVRVSQPGQQGVDVLGAAHEDETHAHIEGAKHLRLSHAARSLEPLKDRRHRPAPFIDAEPPSVGQGPREVVRNPAAGDVSHAANPARLEERTNRLEIVPVRPQQRRPYRLAQFRNMTGNR
jgi:putative transposase